MQPWRRISAAPLMLRCSIAWGRALPLAVVAASLLAAEPLRAAPPSGWHFASLPGATTGDRARDLLGSEPLLISGPSLPAGASQAAAPQLDPDSPQELLVRACRCSVPEDS